MQVDRIIKTLVVDDERVSRHILRLLLDKDPDVKVIGECANAEEAIKAIERESPDLLFLDIQMPGLGGFDVLERVDAKRISTVIFVTAYDQYALKAFEAHALDYLLKPFRDSRFRMALDRAKLQIGQRRLAEVAEREMASKGANCPAETLEPPGSYTTRFLIKESRRIFYLLDEEIDWVEAADYYARLHVGSRTYMLRIPMAELERKLDPKKFLRIHRHALVNLSRVENVQRYKRQYIVRLRGGIELGVSRSRNKHIEKLLSIGT